MLTWSLGQITLSQRDANGPSHPSSLRRSFIAWWLVFARALLRNINAVHLRLGAVEYTELGKLHAKLGVPVMM
jgi:hypothetical protein